MEAYSIDYDPIIDLYDFSTTNTVMDIGGGRGHLLSKRLKKYPDIEYAIILDLPTVIEEARQNLEVFPNIKKFSFYQLISSQH